MYFRHGVFENSYDRLTDKIRRDLLETLQKKGVVISKIKVDMDTDRMNVSMNLKER